MHSIECPASSFFSILQQTALDFLRISIGKHLDTAAGAVFFKRDVVPDGQATVAKRCRQGENKEEYIDREQRKLRRRWRRAYRSTVICCSI